MAKTTLGTATNAQAAADLIARVGAHPNWSSQSSAIGADPAHTGWVLHANLGSWVAVRNVAENVVYKVLREPARTVKKAGVTTTIYDLEKNALTALSSQLWCCDWWPYDTPKVIAQRPYTYLGCSTSDHGTAPDESQYYLRDTHGDTFAAMVSANAWASVYSVGLDTSANLKLCDADLGLASEVSSLTL